MKSVLLFIVKSTLSIASFVILEKLTYLFLNKLKPLLQKILTEITFKITNFVGGV